LFVCWLGRLVGRGGWNESAIILRPLPSFPLWPFFSLCASCPLHMARGSHFRSLFHLRFLARCTTHHIFMTLSARLVRLSLPGQASAHISSLPPSRKLDCLSRQQANTVPSLALRRRETSVLCPKNVSRKKVPNSEQTHRMSS
jgi:hypothetical protein